MSAIDRIMSAQTFEKGTPLTIAKGQLPEKGGQPGDTVNGEYLLKVDKIIYRPNSPRIGEHVVVEFSVEETNTEKAPVGSKRSWVQKLSTSAGVSGYKSFLYAALGAESAEEKAKADQVLPKILKAVEESQTHPLTGRKLNCTTVPYKIQGGPTAGTWINLNQFRPAKD